MLDSTRVGVLAAELMESLEEAIPDGAINVTVDTVAVVAEVRFHVDGSEVNLVQVKCTDQRRWVQTGLLNHAAMATATGGNY